MLSLDKALFSNTAGHALVGDPYQLTPSIKDTPTVNGMARILKISRQGRPLAQKFPRVFLHLQSRMVPDVMAIPNRLTYDYQSACDGRAWLDKRPEGRSLLEWSHSECNATSSVIVMDIQKGQLNAGPVTPNGSRFNFYYVNVIVDTLVNLIKSDKCSIFATIGVFTSYTAQRNLLQTATAALQRNSELAHLYIERVKILTKRLGTYPESAYFTPPTVRIPASSSFLLE